MPYDIPLASNATLNSARSGRSVVDRLQARATPSSTNAVAPSRVDDVRPIEPMLQVHQAQVETLRLIAVAIVRGLKALARPYAA